MSNLTSQATSLCQTLFDAGYVAYFAGGWVRDLLLEHPTDEVDIATSAPPEVIQELFPKTIPVGIAFGVVVVVYEGVNFEVATFRKDHPYLDGRHPDGVDFSTPEKDAQRRDFTINGMFYDPLTQTVHDYVGGQQDLKKGVIRAIGEPEKRFQEDRLRMVRAVRFSARFGFPIEQATKEAIQTHASTLFPSVSVERIWQEFKKMTHHKEAFLQLHTLGLLATIFPQLKGVDIEERVAFFPYFPLHCPTTLYLREILADPTFDVCSYLKTSNNERKLLEFFTKSEAIFEQKYPSDHAWAHFYAHPSSSLFLEIARVKSADKAGFHATHEAQKKRLKRHIERIERKTPLVTAAHLQEKGIAPGKQMGELLKRAEEIAINDDVHSAQAVLSSMLKDG